MSGRRVARPARRLRFALLHAVFAATTAACAGSRDATAPGVVEISSEEHADAPRLLLERAAVVCGAGDDARCPFRRIDVAAARGDLVVLGDFGGLLRLYHADGSVRDIGRLGSGPGEYRGAMAADLTDDGTLTLFDLRQFRWVRYDAAGGVIATANLEPFAEFQGADVAGSVIVMQAIPGGDEVGDSVLATFTAVSDTVGVPVEIAAVPTTARTVRGSAMMPMGSFFQPRPVWDAADGPSLAYTDGTRFEIVRFAGEDTLTIRIAIERRPVRQQDIDALLHDRLHSEDPPQYRTAVQAAARESASHFPAFDDVRLLDDGSLWAREAGPPGDSLRWDRFTPEGRLAGFIVLAPDARVLAGDVNSILVLDHDPLDVPLVAWHTFQSDEST